MEPEQISKEITAAFGSAINNFLRDISVFRVGCKILDWIAVMIGGWMQPLLFRHAGVRLLRGYPFVFLLNWFLWSGYFWWTGFFPKWPSVALFFLAVPLAAWDWWVAKRREKRREYVFSRFLGWPRLIPVEMRASYYLPAVFMFAAGLGLRTWNYDPAGGDWWMLSSVAGMLRLYVIGALRREDALDLLDNSWLAENRSTATQDIAGAGAVQASVPTAVAVTTADLVRRWSV